MTERLNKFLFPTLAIVALVLGYLLARKAWWYCDDIFITLRYVENLFAGNGLVFNAGERVEGYTHVLWLGIVAAARGVGFEPLESALNVGLFSYLATIFVFCVISYRIAVRKLPFMVPATALLLAVNYEANIWATSGMETSFFTLLLSLGFYFYFFHEAPRAWKIGAAGLTLTLAYLTRPDAAVIVVVSFGALIVSGILRRLCFKSLAAEFALFAAPFLLLAVPHLLWRHSYYGEWLPNTYFAKSGGETYFEQGFYYLWSYFRAYPTSFLALGAIPILGVLFVKRRDDSGSAGAALFSLAAVSAYLFLFVARVGGDFMYARFLVPMLPFLYFLVEWSLQRMPRRIAVAAPVLFLLLAVFTFTVEKASRDRMLLMDGPNTEELVERNRGIVDEHYFYTVVHPLPALRGIGQSLRSYFAGLDATVVLLGAQAWLGYDANFATCIEYRGLTDSVIAHQPLERRGRIGHEKEARPEYLFARGADLTFGQLPLPGRDYRQVAFRVRGQVLPGELITYDASLIRALEKRFGEDFGHTVFENWLDRYMENDLPQKSRADLARDYSEFSEFYFDHNDDPERQSVFEAHL